MPLRETNVQATKWNVDGNALGAPDLTISDNQVFGANVFSQLVQRQRLPKDVYKRLSQTLAKGASLDTSLADAVALAQFGVARPELGRRAHHRRWWPRRPSSA